MRCVIIITLLTLRVMFVDFGLVFFYFLVLATVRATYQCDVHESLEARSLKSNWNLTSYNITSGQ